MGGTPQSSILDSYFPLQTLHLGVPPLIETSVYPIISLLSFYSQYCPNINIVYK